ncbi:unnamed protein product [Notodromas monacha]|uniref:Cullin family profile domain-containing protein n=1 Tax=Notodromas monacha TaxID=399045 RepID=A0A7R9BLD8_9CRUS|nr:unnamed protein product [Notodromas monacha]CAG0916301.1 unnamed protein product [Notodromas monacha]
MFFQMWRRPTPESSHTVEELLWEEIKRDLENVLLWQQTYLAFDELYMKTYGLIQANGTERTENEVLQVVSSHMRNHILPQLAQLQNTTLLESLVRHFNTFELSMQKFAQIMIYLDHTDTEDTPRNGKIYTKGIEAFHTQILCDPEVQSSWNSAMNHVIFLDRKGETHDPALVAQFFRMLHKFPSSIVQYQRSFMEDTAQYYANKANQTIPSKVCGMDGTSYILCMEAYLRNVETFMEMETQRLNLFQTDSFVESVTECIRTEMIWKHIDTLVEINDFGVADMIKKNDSTTLRVTYRMLLPLKNGLDIMKKSISKFIQSFFNDILGKPDHQNANAIQELVDFKIHLDESLIHSLDHHPEIVNEVNKNFAEVMNRGTETQKLLAQFIHNMLRKDVVKFGKDSLTSRLRASAELLRLISDKSYFLSHYRLSLASRILHDNSESLEHEKILLREIELDNGKQFTVYFQIMCQDMHDSKKMQGWETDFNFSSPKEQIKLIPKILTTGIWPVPMTTTKTCRLPEIVQYTWDNFAYYRMNHAKGTYDHRSRNANLLLEHGNFEVQASFLMTLENPNQQRHHATHLGKLKRFHEEKFIRTECGTIRNHLFQDIMLGTEMQEHNISHTLEVLMNPMHPILLKQPPSKIIGPTDTFIINNNFYSEAFKIPIHKVLLLSPQKITVKKATHYQIDRAQSLDAAVVRIAKSSQKIFHETLVGEVKKQLLPWFVPTNGEIKRSLESLIEREFINRVPENKSVQRFDLGNMPPKHFETDIIAIVLIPRKPSKPR